MKTPCWQGRASAHPLSRARGHTHEHPHCDRDGYLNPSSGPDWWRVRWKHCDPTPTPTPIGQRPSSRVGKKDAPISWPCWQGGCGPAGEYWEHCVLAPQHHGGGCWMARGACVGSGCGRQWPALHGCSRIPSASEMTLVSVSLFQMQPRRREGPFFVLVILHFLRLLWWIAGRSWCGRRWRVTLLWHHKPGFSSLVMGWYWSVVDVGGDSKRLPVWGDDDLVVISSNGADMEPHVARRHVKASAKGVVNLGAGILEDILVVIDGRVDVNRERYCILHVCQELLMSIEAGACSKDCWGGLGLGAKNRPHEGPDPVVQALYPGRGETLALVQNKCRPGLIRFRALGDVVDVLSRPEAAVGRERTVGLEPHAVSIPWPYGLVAMIVLVDGPRTSALGVF